MFFSRKKEKIEAAVSENAAYFAKAIADTQKKMAKVQKIQDAGERYLAWLDLEENIAGLIDEGTRKANQGVEALLARPRRKLANGIGFSGIGTGAILLSGGMVALVASGAGLAAVVAIGGIGLMIGGPMTAIKMENKDLSASDNVLAEGRRGFCQTMQHLLGSAESQCEAILENEAPALLGSSQIGTICDKVPAIRDAFIKAALNDDLFSRPVRIDKPSPRALKK